MPLRDREQSRLYNRNYEAAHPEQTRAHKQAYRERHPERIREQRRLYRLKNADKRRAYRLAHPEQNKIYAAKYRASHQEQHAARIRAYAQARPEKARERVRRYYANHTDEMIARNQKRRAQKSGAPRNNFTTAQWHMLQAQYGHRCAYCKKRCKGKLTQDHITPLSQGGAHTLQNIVPACRPCNSKKGTRGVLTTIQPLLI